ncbi:MAG: SPOR domain-containing protein [Sulfuricaulis sp.]|uniref:SPOR domain-containing protein n=1 Tax=Sulfuricaulis sp. TaxID=2003553 RepID=UPI003C63F815
MKLKWLFATFVLANIGLWMWASWYKETPIEETRAARAPLALEKMRLLTEPNVKLTPRKTPPPANAELMANAVPVCFHLGPFTDTARVTQAETKLNELHLGFARRTDETKMITGYRVYLPPLASKEAAERKRQELTRLGFKDHAVFQEEGWHNAISLGLFSVEANATARVRELAAKGVEASMQPLTQDRTLYWLDLLEPTAQDNIVKLKQADWGAKEVQLHESTCPSPRTKSNGSP